MAEKEKKAPVVTYNEELHQYKIDGKVVPTVTELATKFSNLKTDWLREHPQYAEHGTVVHNELALYYAEGKELTEPDAIAIAEQLLPSDDMQTEVLVYNQTLGYAGTCDMLVVSGKVVRYIIDFKTGRHLNSKYCRCQLSLYMLALEDMGLDVSTAKLMIINPESSFVFEPWSWKEMVALEKCDFVPTGTDESEIETLEARLAQLEPYYNQYNSVKEELKALMLKKFQETGTSGYAGQVYSMQYVAPSKRRTLDSDKVKTLLGDKLADCYKDTEVAATVKLKNL